MIYATKKIRVDRTLNTNNVNELSPRSIFSSVYGPAGYNSATGVFSIPKYTSQLDNDSGFITEGYYTPGVGIQIDAGGSISSTVPFYSNELARLAISAGPGISYDSTTGVISNTGGSGSSSGFSGSYLDLTNKPTIPTTTSQLTNNSGFITSSALAGYATETFVTTALGSKVNTSSLATVATSGSYLDLTNKPTLFNGSYVDLTNKPFIPSNTSELMNGAEFITSSALNGYATETFVNSAVSNLVASAPAALNTLNELATALGNDANYSTTISTALGNRLRVDVSNQTLTTTEKSNAVTNLGLATIATSGSYNDLSNKPTIPTNNNQLTNGAGYITSSAITGKQDTLVSGVNIKTINGISILGNGNISLSSGGLTLASFTAGAGIIYDNGTGVISSSITQYTDSLARTAISFVAGSGAYNSSTGVITVPTNTSHLTNDAGFITASAISGKQNTLVSGVSIKTINGTSILGNGNISVTGGSGVSLPDQTGNAGKHLTTDGSNLSWVTPTTSPAGTINFDFGNFNKTFTDPISYLLDTVGMDFGVFTQTENLPVDLGTI